jgi:hypothetical protein
MKSWMKEALQEVLEAKMTRLLGSDLQERQDGSQGYGAATTKAGLERLTSRISGTGH